MARARSGRRRRPRDGRRPQLPDRGAAAEHLEEPRDDPRPRRGRRPARALPRAWKTSTATPGSGCSPRTPSTTRTRSSRRWSATTPCGHTCSRRPSPGAGRVDRSSATGSSATTVLAAWHASYIRRATRPGPAGRASSSAEVADDGRIAASASGGIGARRRRPGRRRRRTMAGDVSFDVVSDFDEQELRNALDQVRREVGQRYDFKGVTVDLDPGEGRARARDRRRASGQGGQGPHRVEGDPARPVAQDLRLGQDRAGRRQQGPPGDRAPARPARRLSPRSSPS